LRRHLIGLGELLALATLVAFGFYIHGGIPDQALYRAYILFVCSLLAFLMIQLTRHSGDARPVALVRATAAGAPELPKELATVADLLRAGSASRPDFDRSVRPLLREIAVDRLMVAGVDLRRDPERARELLGADEAELVLFEGPSHATVQERGPRPSEIAKLIDRLEAVGR